MAGEIFESVDDGLAYILLHLEGVVLCESGKETVLATSNKSCLAFIGFSPWNKREGGYGEDDCCQVGKCANGSIFKNKFDFVAAGWDRNIHIAIDIVIIGLDLAIVYKNFPAGEVVGVKSGHRGLINPEYHFGC